MSPLTQQQKTFIFQSGILAPSADNVHEFVFQEDSNSIRLINTSQIPPVISGYRSVLKLIALGAVAENMIIAATQFGIDLQMTVTPPSNNDPLILTFKKSETSIPVDPLIDQIPLRHTNRQLFFSGPKLSPDELKELESISRKQPDVSLSWFDERKARQRILPLIEKAERARFQNKFLHQDISSAVNFSAGWDKSAEEGIPPGALEIEKPMRPLISLLMRWSTMKLLNKFGVSHMMGLRIAKLPCRFASHLGVITVSSLSIQNVLASGRSFQRIWLTATKQGRSLQPLVGAPLYALPGSSEQGVPASLMIHLQSRWKEIVPSAEIPLILFRMGFAPPPTVVTSRKPLANYWHPEKSDPNEC